MKVSTLIKTLKQFQKLHGNLDIIYNFDDFLSTPYYKHNKKSLIRVSSALNSKEKIIDYCKIYIIK